MMRPGVVLEEYRIGIKQRHGGLAGGTYGGPGHETAFYPKRAMTCKERGGPNWEGEAPAEPPCQARREPRPPRLYHHEKAGRQLQPGLASSAKYMMHFGSAPRQRYIAPRYRPGATSRSSSRTSDQTRDMPR